MQMYVLFLLVISNTYVFHILYHYNKTVIKTSGSETRGQEEAASTRIQANATTTVSYLHAYG